ncbi:FAD:protein FMN transferase [Pirellulaceae bacterium SH449]
MQKNKHNHRRPWLKQCLATAIGVGVFGPRHFAACAAADDAVGDSDIAEVSIPAMGSVLTVRWEQPSGQHFAVAVIRQLADELIDRWNAILSDYDEDSEVSKLSNPKVHSKWQSVSNELAESLDLAKEWHDFSHGAFDVTCGAVTSLRRRRRPPTSDQWQSAIQSVGWDGVLWDSEKNVVRIVKPGLKFDFGGIGKGIVIDKLFDQLSGMGLERFIINFSGNMRAALPPTGRTGWPIEIESLSEDTSLSSKTAPDFPKPPYRFRLANLSLSSSGDQWQNFPDANSQSPKDLSSHIIDPTTGFGIRGKQLASVLTKYAADADAASTATCIQMRKAGKAWLKELQALRGGGTFGVVQEVIGNELEITEFGSFLDYIRQST